MPNQVFGSNNWTNAVNMINDDPMIIEVETPGQPVVVEVQTLGPQGPPGAAGPSAPIKTVRIDSSTVNVVYVGKAAQGSSESNAVWIIRKSIFSAAGVLTSTGTATNVTWTGRTGHTYT